MSWVRIIIAVIIALPMGALAGQVYATKRAAPQMAALANERDALKASQKALRDAVEAAKNEADSLARDKRKLEDQLASAKKAEPVPDRNLEAVGGPAGAIFDSGVPENTDASIDGDRRSQGGNPNESDAERDARMARWRQDREQRGQEMRDRMRNFIDQQIQAAPDKATQNRLSSISAYSENMMDLFQQMHNAQTDDERDAIRDQLRENGQATRQLVQEQQDYLMRQSLSQSGVTDPKAQNAAMQSLRQTMEGRFFRGPLAWSGGDFGGGFYGSGRGRGSGRGSDSGG